jgi:hypothetical protein
LAICKPRPKPIVSSCNVLQGFHRASLPIGLSNILARFQANSIWGISNHLKYAGLHQY